MEDSAEFQAHVQRLFTPLKPGLAYVRTEEFATDDFEPDEDLRGLTHDMLLRARKEAIECLSIVETDIMEQLNHDAHRYIREAGEQPGWGAANEEEMRVNLAEFCNTNIIRWDDIHFPEYKEQSPGVLDDAGFEYVKSFVGSALAALPYHTTEGEEEIYYDSDETEKADE